MLFKAYHAPMILAGIKTQTRRRWKRPMVKVGGTYAAQTGFCKPETAFARIKVLRLWREPLGDISEEDSRSEGYENRELYLDAYCEINRLSRTHVDLGQVVTCIQFEVVKA